MKVAVLEHLTSSPPDPATRELESEGRAMRDAVVRDLLSLPDIAVSVLHRPDAAMMAHDRLRSVCVEGDRDAALRLEARQVDAALLIAPEEGRILETAVRIVEQEGCRPLGPSPEAIRGSADKFLFCRVLEAAGIRTPASSVLPFSGAARALSRRHRPFILKPRDGCGSLGVRLVRRREEIDTAVAAVRSVTSRDDLLVQDAVAGEDASVQLIAAAPDTPGHTTTLLSLGLVRQEIRVREGTLEYVGGEAPWDHPLKRRAVAVARDAVRALQAACGGVRGYLGVDLILGGDGPTVIEINPRLTTSYIGLRRVCRSNLAQWILDAALGRPLPAYARTNGHCVFRCDGRLRRREHRASAPERDDGAAVTIWPSTSGGTSVASI